MPVHSREKKESNHEDMEVDFPEQDGSSSDEEDTVSSSVSDDGDSSGKKKKRALDMNTKLNSQTRGFCLAITHCYIRY